MRQRARPIERSKDPNVIQAREVLRGAVYRPEEPEHEYHPVLCELLHEAERRGGGDPLETSCHWIALVYKLVGVAEPTERPTND